MSDVSICGLHYWELVLVQMYRAWQAEGPTRAIVAHRLAARLKDERIYPVIDRIFRLFDLLAGADQDEELAGQDQLSRKELLLLDLAAGDFAVLTNGEALFPAGGQVVQRFAVELTEGLAQAGIEIRPCRSLALSEEERLELAISRSYRMLCGLE